MNYDALDGCIMEDKGLYCLGWYLCWNIGDTEAVLDGTFTSTELRAIADYMDNNKE